MAANVTVNDDRWQFIAGDKYFVLGTIRFSGTYVAGGVPLSFTDPRNPIPASAALVKSTRAPFFSSIPPNSAGDTFVYISPSQNLGIDPPNTVGTAGGAPDINNGLLKIISAGGTEFSGSLSGIAPVTGIFIFQGME